LGTLEYDVSNIHLAAFVFVPSVFGEKFPTAEFFIISAEMTLGGKVENGIVDPHSAKQCCGSMTFCYVSEFGSADPCL
jgi:hypothetical protein